MENTFEQLDMLLFNLHKLTGYGFVWKRSKYCLSEHRLKYCNIHRCEFCNNYKEKNGIRNCLHHDSGIIPNLLKENGSRFFQTTCPAGAVELVVPIVRNEDICGVILVGPFSPEDKEITNLPKLTSQKIDSLVQLLRYLVSPLAANLARRNSLHNVKDSRIRAVLDYLDMHFQENPDVTTLADMFYLSPSRFSHLFREECGIYLSAYINELKLSEAFELLRDSDNTITNISYACGFSDANHFSSSFKKKYGKSPREIRKDWKNIV